MDKIAEHIAKFNAPEGAVFCDGPDRCENEKYDKNSEKCKNCIDEHNNWEYR